MDYIENDIKDYVSYIKYVRDILKIFPDSKITLKEFETDIKSKEINILKNVCMVSDDELENAYLKSQLIFCNLDLVSNTDYSKTYCVGDEWKLETSRDVKMLSRAISNILYAPWVMSYLKNDKQYQEQQEDRERKWNPLRSYIVKKLFPEFPMMHYHTERNPLKIKDIKLYYNPYFDKNPFDGVSGVMFLFRGDHCDYDLDLSYTEENYRIMLDRIVKILSNRDYFRQYMYIY